MALLMSRVDLDTIWLVGRWWSDTMLHSPHITSKSFTDGLVVLMFQYSDYALILPAHAAV